MLLPSELVGAWQNGATYDVYKNNKASQVYDLQGFA